MKFWPRSLFWHVVSTQATIAVVIAISLPFVTSRLLTLTADDFIERRMYADLDRLRTHLVHRPAGWELTPGLQMGASYDHPEGSRNFIVLDDHGGIVSSTSRPFPVPVGEIPHAEAQQHFYTGSIDLSVMPVAVAGSRAWVAVSQDRRHPEVVVDDVVSTFLRRFLWIIPVEIATVLVLTLIFFGRSTRMIEDVARKADMIDMNRLDVRLDAAMLPTEVQPIAHAVNRALDRVRDGFEAQREFVANVAHELRTPIATISLRAEGVDDPVLKAQLEESIAHVSHVIAQVMGLANVENYRPTMEMVDLHAIILAIVTDTAAVVFKSGRSLEIGTSKIPAAIVWGAPSLIRIALANLIDNAARHTHEGARILITIVDPCTLAVDDDGPGIAMSDRNQARNRYWRADNKRTDSAGLGLSIVERAMQAQNGALDIDESPFGGARMMLRFPST